MNIVDTESKARFEREFRALQRLRHENVVKVFETGEYEGRPYFTMQLVQGVPLDVFVGAAAGGADGRAAAGQDHLRALQYHHWMLQGPPVRHGLRLRALVVPWRCGGGGEEAPRHTARASWRGSYSLCPARAR